MFEPWNRCDCFLYIHDLCDILYKDTQLSKMDPLRIDYCDERLVYLYDDSSGTKGVTYEFDTSAESLHFYLSNDIQLVLAGLKLKGEEI